MIFSSDLTIWVRWVNQIHRKRSTQYCELGWGSLHYLWIWEGRKREKRSSYTSLSTDTQCCFLQLRYFLQMPRWDCKIFCSADFLVSKTLSSEPTNTFSDIHTYEFLTVLRKYYKKRPKLYQTTKLLGYNHMIWSTHYAQWKPKLNRYEMFCPNWQ